MATVNDLINTALKEINILTASETASTEEVADAFAALNRMIGQWQIENLLIYAFRDPAPTFVMTPNQATYSIGPTAFTGVVIPVRPGTIDHINVVDTSPTPDIEYPLESYTPDAWAAVPSKLLTSFRPLGYYYSPTFPDGTLHLYPVPTGTTLQGVLYVLEPVTTFSSVATTVSLPPGYEEMLVTNLALRLCSSYGKQIDPTLFGRAQEAKTLVKRSNSNRLSDMSFEAGALVGNGGWRGDIRTGP
jgi:hypothetical protein